MKELQNLGKLINFLTLNFKSVVTLTKKVRSYSFHLSADSFGININLEHC